MTCFAFLALNAFPRVEGNNTGQFVKIEESAVFHTCSKHLLTSAPGRSNSSLKGVSGQWNALWPARHEAGSTECDMGKNIST